MTTIRQQLTRRLLLATGLLIASGSAVVYLCARAALLAQFDAALRAKAQALTTLTEQAGGKVEIEYSSDQIQSLEAGGSDFFELRLNDGTTVERSHSLRDAHLPRRQENPTAPVFWDLTLPDGAPGRALEVRFRPHLEDDRPGDQTAEAVLVVASNRHHLDRTLFSLRLVLAGCGILLLAANALVVPRVLRRALRPLQQLADQATRIDAASLSKRFPSEHLPGELEPITARLNELLARLEESFERERRFSSDVAHEFRTPIAELRSLAELAIALPDTRATQTDHDVLTIALHLESVLTRLLTLARGERGDLPAQRQHLELAPLVEAVCQSFQSKASDRQLTLQWRVPPDAATVSDPVLLRSILTNLVDNAVEHSPRGGSVNLEAGLNQGRLWVRVVNSTDELEECDLPHLFDRFWRKDAARTHNGHTGLGLSLARMFARTLGCELSPSFVEPGRLALVLAEVEGPLPVQRPVG